MPLPLLWRCEWIFDLPLWVYDRRTFATSYSLGMGDIRIRLRARISVVEYLPMWSKWRNVQHIKNEIMASNVDNYNWYLNLIRLSKSYFVLASALKSKVSHINDSIWLSAFDAGHPPADTQNKTIYRPFVVIGSHDLRPNHHADADDDVEAFRCLNNDHSCVDLERDCRK